MPVTLTVSSNITPNIVQAPPLPSSNSSKPQPVTAFDIARCCNSSGLGESETAQLIQSTVSTKDIPYIIPQVNGFVHTCVLAYNQHHHLIIRPDDVWVAILSQFNLYVNRHAEEMREWFVEHKGQKQLEIKTQGNSSSVQWDWLAECMADLIKDNVKDPELHSWITPSFTTTTTTDTAIASIIMMSTLKSYFAYKLTLSCGIPTVTLQGERSDWESILDRVQLLSRFNKTGAHPDLIRWQSLLLPILTRFIAGFDCQGYNQPTPESLTQFWSNICDRRSFGSGPRYLTGWITAFCVFSGDAEEPVHGAIGNRKRLGDWQGTTHRPWNCHNDDVFFKIGEITYPLIDTNDIPPGWAEVDVLVDDNGRKYAGRMMAGCVGTKAVRCISHAGSIEKTDEEAQRERDAVEPYQAWFMVDIGDEGKVDDAEYFLWEGRIVAPRRGY